MRRKDFCWWTQRRQIPRCRPSASGFQRSLCNISHARQHLSPSTGVGGLNTYWEHILLQLQEKIEVTQKRDVEGMGIPEIKYGESMCFVQHASSGLWLTYAAVDAKSARLGPLKRKVKQKTFSLLCMSVEFMYVSLKNTHV